MSGEWWGAATVARHAFVVVVCRGIREQRKHLRRGQIQTNCGWEWSAGLHLLPDCA